jgi:hypothetical protein
MREIIATVISIISCIVYLAIVPRGILSVPKILADMPAGIDKYEAKRVYKRATLKPKLTAFLCAVATFFSVGVRGIDNVQLHPNLFLVAVYAFLILGLVLGVLIIKFYSKIERAYEERMPKSARYPGRIEGMSGGIVIVIAIYGIIALFL